MVLIVYISVLKENNDDLRSFCYRVIPANDTSFCNDKRFPLSFFKGALSGLGQFLAAETPLKMVKNAFYFTSKIPFVLKIFKFLS